MERLLFVIPHFCARTPNAAPRRHSSERGPGEARISALNACITSLHQQFGSSQSMIHLAQRRTEPANTRRRWKIDVVVCTSGNDHILGNLPTLKRLYQHYPTDAAPERLGYECHAILRDRWGSHDYYCYLEDDLILHDPWFFAKLRWFNGCVGDDKVLQPNRFERTFGRRDHKVYVDGDLDERVTAGFQNIREEARLRSQALGERLVFRRAPNPHSGCFFLNAEQMRHWINQPYFCDYSASFIGPLESAATLGIMRAFQVYKPARAHANFLEVEHFGQQFADLIR